MGFQMTGFSVNLQKALQIDHLTHSFVCRTRQNGLQNNWLLRAYIANIQEIEQPLPSIQGIISHTKDKTATKCVAIQKNL